MGLLSPSLSTQLITRLRDLYGSSIAFAIRSFDHSLFARLILCRNHQKRIDWSLQNHSGKYCNQFELLGQTRLPVVSFIPTFNLEEPENLPKIWSRDSLIYIGFVEIAGDNLDIFLQNKEAVFNHPRDKFPSFHFGGRRCIVNI